MNDKNYLKFMFAFYLHNFNRNRDQKEGMFTGYVYMLLWWYNVMRHRHHHIHHKTNITRNQIIHATVTTRPCPTFWIGIKCVLKVELEVCILKLQPNLKRRKEGCCNLTNCDIASHSHLCNRYSAIPPFLLFKILSVTVFNVDRMCKGLKNISITTFPSKVLGINYTFVNLRQLLRFDITKVR